MSATFQTLETKLKTCIDASLDNVSSSSNIKPIAAPDGLIGIYQISGCSDSLKTWVQNLLDENGFEYHLNKMTDGWCFDLDQTKEWISKPSFFELLADSNLSDLDKQFVLQSI